VPNAAEDARRLLARNLDPIDERDRQSAGACCADGSGNGAAIGGRVTLRRYTREYHSKHVEPVRSFKHARQWINGIEQHVPCALLDTAVDLISPVELLDALVPILREVPETGSRIYQRLTTVFDAAVIEGLWREKPATPIRRELTKRAGRRERTNFASLPYREAPAFLKRLLKAPGRSGLTIAMKRRSLLGEVFRRDGYANWLPRCGCHIRPAYR